MAFRAALNSTSRLDENGYVVIPFATRLDELSPLTRNHKVLAVEAEIIGADVGDTVGRVYLRQRGTGVVKDVEDEKIFYTLPARTAVVNTFFNGQRVYPSNVYRNSRLRDRPLVNTRYDLVVNTRDESVNADINLSSLNDIRIYLYYSDFTQL